MQHASAAGQEERAPQRFEPGKTVLVDGCLGSVNPATCELVGTVNMTPADAVQGVVDSVEAVQPFWGGLGLEDRARYLRRAAQVILDEIEDLADLIAREQGKSVTESYAMELLPSVDALHWCADRGPEILSAEKLRFSQLFLKHKSSYFTYEALGTVAVIAPWNYPWTIPFGEVAIALMAGNGVVLKPAELTPLLGERICEVFQRAGLPEGIVRTVQGFGDVGAALVASSVRKVFFTGSVEVGRSVGETCAAMMKESVLELGGKDAQIVCADAYLGKAISGGAWGAFANTGQTCAGIERAYVARPVFDDYVAGVVAEAQRLRIGDPTDPRVEIGPMTSAKQWAKVKELVDDAVTNGATVQFGGTLASPGLPGNFFTPTVLTDVTHDMRIMREEVFGPVLPIIAVDSDEEAVALANDSRFGLGASVWTRDRGKGKRMSRMLETGMVWINDHAFTHGACECSWGGVKDSGLGRSHSKFGFYECVNVKNVTADPGFTRNLWWYPYGQDTVDALRAASRALYSESGDRVKALGKGAGAMARLVGRSIKGP